MKRNNSNKLALTIFKMSLLLLLLFPQLINSQTFDTTYARILQNAVNNLKNTHQLVGISAAVYVPRQGTWMGTAGISEENVNVTPQMVFGIGSITKNFVSAIILQLSDADSLNLDDSLHEWLPVYNNIDTNVTIRQLLNHTSGIYNFTDNPAFLNDINSNLNRVWTLEEVVSGYVLPRVFPAGTSWSYSNTNYVLLSMIITKITGTNLSTQLRNRFFTPLNMNESYLETQDSIASPYAHNWVDLNGNGTLDDAFFIPRTALYSSTIGAGGIISRPENLLKWMRALYGGNIISQNSLTQMLTFRNANISGANGYGLGTMRYNVSGKICWGHAGNIFGYAAVMMYYPVDSICIAVLMNKDLNTGPVGISFMNTVLSNNPIGIKNITNNIVKNYKLNQNYPNPFNPETNIKIEIPQKSLVKLMIYDVLGREVKTLVNEVLNPGEYNVKWNASGYPSGVYFYKLIADNFIQSKKMILSK